MKQSIILVTALAAVALSSCRKDIQPDLVPSAQEISSLTVNVLGGTPTKASGSQAALDVTIKNAQVFVFNKRTGQVDNAEYRTFSSTTNSCTMPQMSCSFGEKEVWAVVNAPKDYVAEGTIKTLDDLKATTVLLSHNSLDALVMTGSAVKSLSQATETLSLSVDRLVAAVVLKSLRNEMGVPAYRDSFTLTGAYLMNVPAVQRLDGTILASGSESPVSGWNAFYAKAGADEPSDLLVEAITETAVAYETSHETPHTFYSFSNNHNKVAGTDSKTEKSSTYLVVECKVDGTACVYPVLLPQLERNKKYEVSLTVRHVGGDPSRPWDKIVFSAFTPSVTVSDWGTPVAVTETI